MDIRVFTNTGDHKPNEDYTDFIEKNDIVCAIVADGLGGHGSGEVASKTAVEAALAWFSSNPEISKQCVEGCFSAAYYALKSKADEDNQLMDMKTTMAVFISDGNQYVRGHIGDTRIYIFSDSKVLLQSSDHSVPQSLVISGELKTSEIRHHEDRNKLFRVLETSDMPKAEIQEVKVLPNRAKGVLLCTDGFWEYILEQEMIGYLSKYKSCSVWVTKMAEHVRNTGSKNTSRNMDNYTCLGICLDNHGAGSGRAKRNLNWFVGILAFIAFAFAVSLFSAGYIRLPFLKKLRLSSPKLRRYKWQHKRRLNRAV